MSTADDGLCALAKRGKRAGLRVGWTAFWMFTAALAAFGAAVVADELRTSSLQARYFTDEADAMWFWKGPGASPAIRFPHTGPYDHRLGHAALPELLQRLTSRGFVIEEQARQTPALVRLIDAGYSPPFRERTQAGLTVLDCRADTLFRFAYPQRAYASFDAIPRIIVNTLLWIENRDLLDARFPERNPAIEWPRLFKALFAQGMRVIDPARDAPGGSTLATQMEKYRHSPSGVTADAREKFRQMYSASLRVYAAGADTSAARKAIVLDYLNTFPLAAAPGYGEVRGLGDGLWVWYGARFEDVNAALASVSANGNVDLRADALAYRQVLSLVIAQRRPSYFLTAGRERLAALTDSYLRLLAEAGVIPSALRDAALAADVDLRDSAPPPQLGIASPKAVHAVRAGLLSLIGGRTFYELDRYDLTAKSTFDAALQQAVAQTLRRQNDPRHVAESGLDGRGLIGDADPAHVVYSFTLYERGAGFNLVRAQFDTGGAAFDVNAGARLELGSTAKLRTLATYLDLVAQLHARYAGESAQALLATYIDPRDRIGAWAVDYLAYAEDRSLDAMLQAALERRYSAHAGERFFTAGGVHRFSNFSARSNGLTPTVRDAFRKSINLPFIRLMRDIVHHHMFSGPASAAPLLDDADHPQRAAWLARFADYEGTQFLHRFYGRYRDLSGPAALDVLARRAKGIPLRLAVAFRSARPDADFYAFARFVNAHAEIPVDARWLADAYESYAIGRFSLHDRGYLARIHPLELWLVGYLGTHADARFDAVVAASHAERQAVYQWLYKRSKRAQDTRIRILLEIDAFEKIHAHWKRLGYPFDALVPSYATAIGVSGDNPAALAELTGVILNGGWRLPTVRIEALEFAAGTPYETVLARGRTRERVMHEAVAAALRDALVRVVEGGTARRIDGAYTMADGTPLVIGGKTGTGDNQHKTFAPGGVLLESRKVNRTATFTFFLGDRHFGVLTAYAPEPYAADYAFTSALPVQIVKNMAPTLAPYVQGAARRCAAAD